METTNKVLCVEDHSSFREGLAYLLSRRAGFEVAQAGTSEEALALMGEGTMDAVLVDLGLPGTDGVSLIRELRRSDPRVPILVLTIHLDPDWHDRAREAGAEKVLTKDAPLEEIIAAVEGAVRE
jgi:DNA-binding NarL/FixJ family response regulator